MKARLRITRNGALLYEGVHDIADAASFGGACANAWNGLLERKFSNATSIGALQESLGENMLGELDGLKIGITPVDP